MKCPALFALLGIAILVYAAMLWARGKTSNRNLMANSGEESVEGTRDIDKDIDPDEFSQTIWLWVTCGLAAIGYGIYLKIF